MPHLRTAIPVALMVTGLAGCAPTGETADVSPEYGQALYAEKCAVCHGDDGRGAGPASLGLGDPPPDLTTLEADNDGVFPTAWVAAKIDGRDPVVSHGGMMPVWGNFFEGDSAAIPSEFGQPILTSTAIADLIEWLMQVQE